MSSNVPSYTIDLVPEPYQYEGEIIDPEQDPITSSVYRCRTCAGLVTWPAQADHTTWHEALLGGIGEAMAILIRSNTNT